jgi:hypothetical protein
MSQPFEQTMDRFELFSVVEPHGTISLVVGTSHTLTVVQPHQLPLGKVVSSHSDSPKNK